MSHEKMITDNPAMITGSLVVMLGKIVAENGGE